MSIRAQRISFGLAVLPFIVVSALSVLLSSAELFVLATSFMGLVFLLVAHLIVAPISSFVAGLEKVGDPVASAATILAAMPSEPMAVLALAAADAGHALHDSVATLHELPATSETRRSAAA